MAHVMELQPPNSPVFFSLCLSYCIPGDIVSPLRSTEALGCPCAFIKITTTSWMLDIHCLALHQHEAVGYQLSFPPPHRGCWISTVLPSTTSRLVDIHCLTLHHIEAGGYPLSCSSPHRGWWIITVLLSTTLRLVDIHCLALYHI